VKKVREHSFYGQDEAVKAMAMVAYAHVFRIKKIVNGEVNIPDKMNCLCVGSSGSGKSMLGEIIFRRILDIPCEIFQANSMTESGYVGDSLENLIPRLISATPDKDPIKASLGCLIGEEIDKCCESDGLKTSRDKVSRFGVMRELISFISGFTGYFATEPDKPPPYCNTIKFFPEHVLFVCLGAFQNYSNYVNPIKQLGFIHSDQKSNDMEITAAGMEKYGMLLELYARLQIVCRFSPLSSETLLDILNRNIISKQEANLWKSGVELIINTDVRKHIVTAAEKQGTGARGLHGCLDKYIRDALYETYSDPSVKGIRLFMSSNDIQWDLKHEKNRKARQSNVIEVDTGEVAVAD